MSVKKSDLSRLELLRLKAGKLASYGQQFIEDNVPHKHVTDEEYLLRMAICQSCKDGFVEDDNPKDPDEPEPQCRFCGCVLTWKASLESLGGRTITCPHPQEGNKWDLFRNQ